MPPTWCSVPRLFLVRHPTEKGMIEELATKRVLEAAGQLEASER